MGQLDRAERAFAEVAAAARAAGLVQGSPTASTQQVNVQRLRGARRALAWPGGRGWASGDVLPSTLGRLRTVLAELLLDEDDLTAAWPLATRRAGRPTRVRERAAARAAGQPSVRLRLAEGDTAAAGAVLAEVRPLVQHGPFAMVAQLLEAAEARVHLAQGDGAAAVAWAAAVLLDRPGRADGAGGRSGSAPPASRPRASRRRGPGRPGTGHRRRRPASAAERHLEAAGRLAEGQGVGWLRLRC